MSAPDDPAPLPEAKIVDRESTYDKASRIGLAVVGAVFTMWSELLAILLLGVVLGDLARHVIRIVDVVAMLGFVALAFVLVRRIVRPSMMSVHLRSGWLDYPSTSWAHAVFDLGYAALGAILVLEASGPAAAGGIACLIVTGALVVLRAVFWHRQREL